MNMVDHVKDICFLLLNNRNEEALLLADNAIPFDGDYIVKDITTECIKLIEQDKSSLPDDFVYSQNAMRESKSGYQKHICTVLLRDGFIDRYTGNKLIFPGILFLLHFEMPNIIKYDKNWDPAFCHRIFWELYPSVDHIVAQTHHGGHELGNLITTLMVINNYKGKKKLSLKRHAPGRLNDWDGLAGIFLQLMDKRKDYVNYSHVENWQARCNGIKKWKRDLKKAVKMGGYILAS